MRCGVLLCSCWFDRRIYTRWRLQVFSRKCLDQIEETLMYEGPQNVAAFIFETVTGTNGAPLALVQPWPCFAHRPQASSCRPMATCRDCAPFATSTTLCSSSTRSWLASGAPASGSRATTGRSCRTSCAWPRVSPPRELLSSLCGRAPSHSTSAICRSVPWLWVTALIATTRRTCFTEVRACRFLRRSFFQSRAPHQG